MIAHGRLDCREEDGRCRAVFQQACRLLGSGANCRFRERPLRIEPVGSIAVARTAAFGALQPMACHWIEYQFEPFGYTADGTRYSKGKIDIGVLFDWERERYLAYECKRLNVIHVSGRRSLATVYVTQDMMRFMTEQYAQHLRIGCMLGYVLDGDIAFAKARLNSAIIFHDTLHGGGGTRRRPDRGHRPRPDRGTWQGAAHRGRSASIHPSMGEIHI